MGSFMKLVAHGIPLASEKAIGLIPLLLGMATVLAGLLVVAGYGLRRLKHSEGLAPGRVEQPYAGPALSWIPTNKPARKLVGHDALGLGSDLAWLKNRREVATSLEPQTYGSEPIVALELAAKVFSTNLPPLAQKNSRAEQSATQPAPPETIAALRNTIPSLSSAAVAPAAPGPRLRTAVLRAADPRPAGAANNLIDAVNAPTASLAASARGQRVSLSVPVGLRGMRDTGPFEVETRTSVVQPQGAIINFSERFECGQEMILVNRQTNQQVDCRVAAAQSVENGKTQVTLVFTSFAPQFWRISFPGDGQSPEAKENRKPASQPLMPNEMRNLASVRG